VRVTFTTCRRRCLCLLDTRCNVMSMCSWRRQFTNMSVTRAPRYTGTLQCLIGVRWATWILTVECWRVDCERDDDTVDCESSLLWVTAVSEFTWYAVCLSARWCGYYCSYCSCSSSLRWLTAHGARHNHTAVATAPNFVFYHQVSCYRGLSV